MNLGPEFRLFCLALRQPRRADDMAEMRRLAVAGPRWDTMVRGARRHRVAAGLVQGLQACGTPHLPDDVITKLRKLSVANARRSLAQIAELRRLAQLFAAAGIRVLVLKGAALAVQLYGDPGARVARDIDLLVDPDQFAEARRLLRQAGYVQRQGFPSAQRSAAYQRRIKEIEFLDPATGGMVELHHRLTDNPYLLECDFSSLWGEREEINLGDLTVATLPRQRLPLYLCVHGADHCWAKLQWLVDFAAAMRSQNVDDALQSATAAGLRGPFMHALLLSHDWLGLPLGDSAVAACRGSSAVARCAWLLARAYSATEWYADPAQDSWQRLWRDSLWTRLYRFSVKSDWRYRRSQLGREWFSPADHEAMPLPEALSWLYPLVRPWGWLIRRRSLPQWRKAPPLVAPGLTTQSLTAPSLTSRSLTAPSPPAPGSAS
jgi:hypothetical protein